MTADYVTLLQRRLAAAMTADLHAAAAAAYARGRAEGYDAGRLNTIAELRRADTDLIRALDARATRWTVRGQMRTRATYADPHPGDYPGMQP